MTNETEQSQGVYSSNDVSITLKIQESTLRKYCLLLEKDGYEFLKNEHGHRAFFDSDIIVLKKLMELKSGGDMTLQQASKAVIAWKNGTGITERDTENSRYVARYNDLVVEFQDFKEQQMNFNKELLMELKKQREENQKQNDYIKNFIDQRTKDLPMLLKESMEARKQLAIAEEQQKKKKPWWKLWE